MKLRPFFTFYGGKYRSVPLYPEPREDRIIEPFAGSAGYGVNYPNKKVCLYDIDPNIVQTWQYLIRVNEAEILGLPDIQEGQSTEDLPICPEARILIGWWLNKGSAQPKKRMSSNMRASVRGLVPKDPPSGWWGEQVRRRIASQLSYIRHWEIHVGDYSTVPQRRATWFIDPPYQKAGKHYRFGANQINYTALGNWCKQREGQLIVCEQEGADWLPFEPLASIKANESRTGGKRSAEAIFTQNFILED